MSRVLSQGMEENICVSWGMYVCAFDTIYLTREWLLPSTKTMCQALLNKKNRGRNTKKSIRFVFTSLLPRCDVCVISSDHNTRRRGNLRVAMPTASNLPGSGRVDMPTRPVAAAGAAVATGASG